MRVVSARPLKKGSIHISIVSLTLRHKLGEFDFAVWILRWLQKYAITPNIILGAQIFNCYTDILDPVQVKSANWPNILFGNRISQEDKQNYPKTRHRGKENEKTDQILSTHLDSYWHKDLISTKVRSTALGEGKRKQCSFLYFLPTRF